MNLHHSNDNWHVKVIIETQKVDSVARERETIAKHDRLIAFIVYD